MAASRAAGLVEWQHPRHLVHAAEAGLHIEYSDIYSTQSGLNDAERQAARDAIISLAPFMNVSKEIPTQPRARPTTSSRRVEILQGQLTLVDAFMSSFDRNYKKNLAATPDGSLPAETARTTPNRSTHTNGLRIGTRNSPGCGGHIAYTPAVICC